MGKDRSKRCDEFCMWIVNIKSINVSQFFQLLWYKINFTVTLIVSRTLHGLNCWWRTLYLLCHILEASDYLKLKRHIAKFGSYVFCFIKDPCLMDCYCSYVFLSNADFTSWKPLYTSALVSARATTKSLVESHLPTTWQETSESGGAQLVVVSTQSFKVKHQILRASSDFRIKLSWVLWILFLVQDGFILAPNSDHQPWLWAQQ